MSTSTLGFSVIVASHGRVKLIEKLLESLNHSRSSMNENVEVLVIDSTPADQSTAIRVTCDRLGAILIKGPLSVRKKRNLGARSGTREWLFFVDSDCEVSQHIFESYRRSFAVNPGSCAAAGPTVFQGGETTFTKLIHRSSLLTPFRRPNNPGSLLWATTSNLCVHRNVFETLGGFREDFPFRLGGDDTDFCLRLRDQGCRIVAVPEAVCFHSWATWSHPLSVVRRSFRWGWMHSRLLRDHPRYRRLDAPGLPIHSLACLFIALIGSFAGGLHLLLTPVLYVVLAVMLHAIFASARSSNRRLAFLEDLTLALVELPFGFGRALESLTNGSLIGVLYRLDTDDTAMDSRFPETVRSLWSDHLAFLFIAFFIGWVT